ncbi:hypothetical protein MUP01_07675 [Candidatus Bathyarchaeota archaeon]|nr:hypothetical protein [Candidatus Bathyarchaeota archaeon]
MPLIGKLKTHDHGVGSIIGAVFVTLILLSGFAFYAVNQDVTQHYNNTISSMNDKDWDRSQENIVIKQVQITSTNKLNVTTENDGSVQSHLIWLGLFNQTATPENQTYQALNEFIKPGEIDVIISSFTVAWGNKYVVQLVTELGNAVESKFYPASFVSCALTLIVTPPTAYQGNNVTVLFTVTPNDTGVDSVQSLTVALNATPSNLVQLVGNSPLSVSGLSQGTTAFFWWLYNATSVGAVVFNGTYNQAPIGAYALASLDILAGNAGPTGPAGPQGPPGFSTNATYVNLIRNYPFGGTPTTLTPTTLGASTCLVYPFEIDRNITVTAIYIRSNAAISNCLRVGIYDSAGTRLYASNALSTVATGWITVTGISITLASGTYHFGTTNNGVSSSTAAYTVTPGIGAATLPSWGSVSTSGGALPASITPSLVTKTVGGWMCYVLLSSVTS